MSLSSIAVITLDDLRTYLKITTSGQDIRLERIIENVTDDIERYIGKPIIVRGFTDEVYPEDQRLASRGSSEYSRFYLKNYPIWSTVISIADPAGNTVAATEYIVNKARGYVARAGLWSTPVDLNNNVAWWNIAYSGGIAADRSTVPGQLKDAALELAQIRHHGYQTVESKSVGDLSVKYTSMEIKSGIPESVALKLSSFVRRDV